MCGFLDSASEGTAFLFFPGAWGSHTLARLHMSPFVPPSAFFSKAVLTHSHYKAQRSKTTFFEILQCS